METGLESVGVIDVLLAPDVVEVAVGEDAVYELQPVGGYVVGYLFLLVGTKGSAVQDDGLEGVFAVEYVAVFLERIDGESLYLHRDYLVMGT
jgi:hypothetical protein